MEILSFFGAIFILFIGKFVWDTYVTGETDKKYEVNRRNNPEETARLENSVRNGKYFNFDYSPKSNKYDREQSLLTLAIIWRCEPGEAEEYYKQSLREIGDSSMPLCTIERNLLSVFSEVRASKHQQAKELNIDPEDTPASLMQEWSRDVVMALRKSFQPKLGLVTISQIKRPENPAAYPADVMTVVFTQKYNDDCDVSDQVNAVLGIETTEADEVRKFSQRYTLMQIASANEGEGLAVGDTAESMAISLLSSRTPFYTGQRLSEKTGLYCWFLLEGTETGQPCDRMVNN